MATTLQLQPIHLQTHLSSLPSPSPTTPPTTIPSLPIQIKCTTPSTTQQPSKRPTTIKTILQASSPPTSNPNTNSTSSHHLRPRSLSFHSPISTANFGSNSSSSSGTGKIYATSPTSSIGSSDSHFSEGLQEMEEEVDDYDYDEEAVVFDDEDDMGMQGNRGERQERMGYAHGGRQDFLVAEKMGRLERARGLLERYGGRR